MISNVEYQNPIGKSDHCVLKFKLNCFTVHRQITKQRKLYHKGDYNTLNREIKDIDWKELLSPYSPDFNIDNCWNTFHRKIMELEDKFIPTSKPKSDAKVRVFPIDKKT